MWLRGDQTIGLCLLLWLGPAQGRVHASPAIEAGLAERDAGTVVDAAAPGALAAGGTPGAGGTLGAALPQRVRVGFTGSAPFVVHAGAEPSGLSIDIWRAVADELGVETRWQAFATVPQLLDAVAARSVDVGVGPISVTSERAQRVDFTQSYFSARVGILSVASSSVWDRLQPFFNRAFLVGVLTLTVVLLCVGALVWFFERGANGRQFPQPPVAGIREGMWFALVTMTTVGYGDRAPVTGAGRLVAGLWMLFAMLAASSVTAGIATALTLSQIDEGGIASLDDIGGRRVAVVRGTPAQTLVVQRGAQALLVSSLEAGVRAVTNGHAQAVVYDLPILDRYLQEHPDLDLVAHRTAARADDYAFAAPIGAPLRRPIDIAVLRLREARQIKQIASDWSVQD